MSYVESLIDLMRCVAREELRDFLLKERLKEVKQEKENLPLGKLEYYIEKDYKGGNTTSFIKLFDFDELE